MKLLLRIFAATALLCLFSCRQEKIVENVILVSSLSLDPSSASMTVGDEIWLDVNYAPADATETDFVWTSTDEAVATVDSEGMVTAVGKGNARIRVSTHDGRVGASCYLVVVEEGETPPDPPENPDTPDNPDNPDTPGTRVRWADTGADVPAYPSYTAVSSYQDFPRVDISVSGSIKKDVYIDGTVRFTDPKSMYKDAGDTDYVTDSGALPMQIRGRGNSTWDYAEGGKKPYRIKLNTATKVFGMGNDKDWVLLADSMDPSQMRNILAQRIAKVISMDFAPRFRTVELYLNNSYAGTYTLIEQKETGLGHKVFVTPVDPASSETDGGYFVELDEKGDDPVSFTSSTFRRKFNFKEPENPNSAQQAFFQQLVNDTETAMKSKNWTRVHELIEMDTWIQNYIIQEIAMNVDGNMRLSTYFAKDKDTKLYMPMVWDFDLAFNNASYLVNFISGSSRDNLYSKWFIKTCGGGQNNPTEQTYYQYLFQDPAFVSRLKELWNLYYPRLQVIDNVYIDKMKEFNAPAFKHATDQGKNPRVRSYSVDNKDFFRTYEDAISYMHTFYTQRLSWLNTNINNL
ncbi:MAG: CotH kinase family protein [Bacteroidales bacterium]|nr:CotH kinase family protein [Bacteroidales bacterium]